MVSAMLKKRRDVDVRLYSIYFRSQIRGQLKRKAYEEAGNTF